MAEREELNKRLVNLAMAVADGACVDWTAVDHLAETEEERRLLRELRTIDSVGRLNKPATTTGDLHTPIAEDGSDSDSPDDPPGAQWGPLRIIEKVGRGSFGDVYRAWDTRLDRTVALKLLRRRDAAAATADVIDEGRLLARVRHPNVVTVYGAERIDGRTGLWMEFVSGRTLREEVMAGGPLPPREVVSIGIDLARALGAVHAAGMLHRDVKAQNVMRDATGRIVLTDFGTGREVVDAALEGDVMGTPLYAAPEVLSGGPATPSSDVYSLGVLLWYLLTGSFPTLGKSIGEIRAGHVRRTVPSLRSLRREVSADLARVVERATALEPARRYETTRDLEWDLARIAAVPNRRRMTAIAAVTVAAVAALGMAAWRFGSNDAPLTGEQTLVQVGVAFPPPFGRGGPSPDGRSVACSDADGRLAICPLDGKTPQLLNIPDARGRAMGNFASFSPDGRQILYLRLVDSVMSLHIVAADGSGDRVLFRPGKDESFLRADGWAADSRTVVGDLMKQDGSHALVLVDTSDGSRRELRRFTAEQPIQRLTLSPDARFAAYDVPAPGSHTRDIVAIEVASGSSSTVIGSDADEFAPVWSPDGTRLLFTSDRGGTLGLWSQPLRGGHASGQPELITDTGREMAVVRGFANGQETVFFDRFRSAFDVLRAKLVLTGAPMEAYRVSPRPLDQNAAADWSPDGSHIAYLSSRARFGVPPGAARVVVQDARTGAEQSWTIDVRIHQASLRWWPDGRSLLLCRGAPGARGVLLQRVDALTGEPLQLLKQTEGITDAVVTRDGSVVVYLTPSEIRELRVADGTERIVARVEAAASIAGTAGMNLSPDEDRVAFHVMTAPGSAMQVRLASRSTGLVEPLTAATPFALQAWMARTGSVLGTTMFGSDARRRTALLLLNPPSTQVVELGLTGEQLRQVRVRPDGGEILFTAGSPRIELWMLHGPR